jgi:hypothetical protein
MNTAEIIGWNDINSEILERADAILIVFGLGKYSVTSVELLGDRMVIHSEYTHCGSCGTDTESVSLSLQEFAADNFREKAAEVRRQVVLARETRRQEQEAALLRQKEERERTELLRLQQKYYTKDEKT